MNRKQKIALWGGAINLAILFLLPPVDSFSFTDPTALMFSGFHFVFSLAANELINKDMLFLENVVLLVNVGIAWLLLRDVRYPVGTKRRFNFQNAILVFVAINLIVILLFPPFEYYFAISKAAFPTFQGFYFIFSAESMLTIVTALLYLEVVFVLFNGAMFWLLFRRSEEKELSPQEAMELMRKISGKK